MDIKITGTPRYVDKKLVRKATKFFASYLMQKRLTDSINLEIKFEKLDHHLGECQPFHDEPGQPPRIFDICIQPSLKKKDLLETLAHEIVHLKQFAKDELYEYDRLPNVHRWRGKKIKGGNDEEELLSPWEIEARGYELGLYYAFCKFLRGKKK